MGPCGTSSCILDADAWDLRVQVRFGDCIQIHPCHFQPWVIGAHPVWVWVCACISVICGPHLDISKHLGQMSTAEHGQYWVIGKLLRAGSEAAAADSTSNTDPCSLLIKEESLLGICF